MSCYIRHLADWMEELGLENTKENRKILDLAIRKSLDLSGDVVHCPEVWQELKTILNSEKEIELLEKIKKFL